MGRSDTSKPFFKLTQEEMFDQGDEESKLNYPISGFMDRNYPQKARMGISFNDFMCHPLIIALKTVFPKMESMMGDLQRTREYWKSCLSEDKIPPID